MGMIKKMQQEEYQEYLEDVDIAISELTSMKLYPVEGKIICDLYAIPSHNFQSYYAIIFERENKYSMLYAKPQFYEPEVQEFIKMYRFRDAKDAENHPAKDGKIILGLKQLPDDFVNVIRDIVDHFPTVKNVDAGGITIDGYFQAIRRYNNNTVVDELVFDNVDSLVVPNGKEYLSEILDELYIRIGEIIE